MGEVLNFSGRMSEREATELDNLIGGGKKKRGCCTSHPILCTISLCILLVLGLAVAVLGTVFHSRVNQAILDEIAEVPMSVEVGRS